MCQIQHSDYYFSGVSVRVRFIYPLADLQHLNPNIYLNLYGFHQVLSAYLIYFMAVKRKHISALIVLQNV